MTPRFETRTWEGSPPSESIGDLPYWGATEGELYSTSGGSRFLALSDQRRLFPHDGTFELTADAIMLRGWRVVERSRVAAVDLTFTPAYSRWLAGGIRGNAASLGVFGDLGKPLVISIAGESPVYLHLGFNWFWGTTRNRWWYPTLLDWLNDPAPRAARRHRQGKG